MLNNLVAFFVFYLMTLLVMKVIGFISSDNKQTGFVSFLFKTPLLTPYSLKRQEFIEITKGIKFKILSNFLINGLLLSFSLSFSIYIFEYFKIEDIYKGYFLIWFLYFLTNFLASSAQILTLLTNSSPRFIHYHPYRAKNISLFWSSHWNRWFRDWLISVSQVMPKNNFFNTRFWAFALSGVFHEIMINTPYFLMTKGNVFGTHMLYFTIQAFAVYLDRKFFKRNTLYRRVFMWTLLVLPCPLFFNDAFMFYFNL